MKTIEKETSVKVTIPALPSSVKLDVPTKELRLDTSEIFTLAGAVGCIALAIAAFYFVEPVLIGWSLTSGAISATSGIVNMVKNK